jgi:aminoglycoside phosphotransferase family enzyme
MEPTAASEPSLESKVAFLARAESYPGPLHRVDAIETHMSWVFVAGAHVYKLKKPVRNASLDFRTLAARRFYCEEELRLNRRLAAAVYIALVPLTLDKMQHLHLAGPGTPVDWLVKMHRLPARRMLDFAIMHKTASERDAGRIAATLAAFHATIPPEQLSPLAYRERFREQIAANRAGLADAAYRLPPQQVDALCRAQTRVLDTGAALLGARASAGHVVEGHGDLRPEHVCLLPRIAIIDCLEFSRELRVQDTADEVGYLALECERLGAAGIGAALLRDYGRHSGDQPPLLLVHFYQSYRASRRALIALRHVQEEKFRYSPYWRKTALVYLDLAARHVANCE